MLSTSFCKTFLAAIFHSLTFALFHRPKHAHELVTLVHLCNVFEGNSWEINPPSLGVALEEHETAGTSWGWSFTICRGTPPSPSFFYYWRVCRLFTNLSPGSGSVRCYLGLRAFSHPPHPVAALGWEWWQFAATREFLLIFFLCFDLLLFVLRKITFDSLQIKNEGRACVRCLMTACSFMIDCFSVRFSQRLQARAVDLPDL